MSASPTATRVAPRLPPELLSEILALESAGSTPVERQLHRQRFMLVCWSWFDAVDKWSELAVTGLTAVDRLCEVLGQAVLVAPGQTAVAGPVKALGVGLEAGQLAGAGLIELIKLVPCVEELWFIVVKGQQTLEPALVRALAGLPRVRKLYMMGVALPDELLHRLVKRWVGLRSFVLYDCSITNKPMPSGYAPAKPPFSSLFAKHSELHALALHGTAAVLTLNAVTAKLPSSLASCYLDCTLVDAAHSLRTNRVVRNLVAAAEHLTDLTLLEPVGLFARHELLVWTRLRTLTLNVALTTDLPPSLAALAELRELRIRCTPGGERLAKLFDGNLVGYMEELPKLEVIELPIQAWNAFDEDDHDDIEAAAVRHSVQLVIA